MISNDERCPTPACRDCELLREGLAEVETVLDAHRAIHDLTALTSTRLEMLAGRMRSRLRPALQLLKSSEGSD